MHTDSESSRPNRGRAVAHAFSRTRIAIAVCSFLLPSLGATQIPSLSSPRGLARLQPLVAGHPSLDARRANIAAAEARARAAGAGTPVALDAEIEEVPSGLEVTRAG